MRCRPIDTRTWAAGAGSNGGRAGASGSALRHHIHLILARGGPKSLGISEFPGTPKRSHVSKHDVVAIALFLISFVN